LAQRFAAAVRADDRFEVVAPHPQSLVCFRLRASASASASAGAEAGAGADAADTDTANETLLRAVNATGRCLLTHTRVAGRYVLRLAVGAPATREEHVDEVWRLIQAAATAEAERSPR
jgi:aromatic-L-amino-acid decarboxylase